MLPTDKDGLNKRYPSAQKKNLFLLKPGAAKREGEGIHFNLAITTKTEKTAKGKVSIRIYVIEGGFGKKDGMINEQVSRISFTVYVTKWAGTYEKPPKKQISKPKSK